MPEAESCVHLHCALHACHAYLDISMACTSNALQGNQSLSFRVKLWCI